MICKKWAEYAIASLKYLDVPYKVIDIYMYRYRYRIYLYHSKCYRIYLYHRNCLYPETLPLDLTSNASYGHVPRWPNNAAGNATMPIPSRMFVAEWIVPKYVGWLTRKHKKHLAGLGYIYIHIYTYIYNIYNIYILCIPLYGGFLSHRGTPKSSSRHG